MASVPYRPVTVVTGGGSVRCHPSRPHSNPKVTAGVGWKGQGTERHEEEGKANRTRDVRVSR